MLVLSLWFMIAIVFSVEWENVCCLLNGLFLLHEKQLPIFTVWLAWFDWQVDRITAIYTAYKGACPAKH